MLLLLLPLRLWLRLRLYSGLHLLLLPLRLWLGLNLELRLRLGLWLHLGLFLLQLLLLLFLFPLPPLLLLLQALLPLLLFPQPLLLPGSLFEFLLRGYLDAPGSSFLRLGFFRRDPTEAFLPAASLATVVLFIEIQVITLTFSMSDPIGIGTLKICVVTRVSLIPHMPLRLIPGVGSDNVDGRIRIIWRPSVLRAEKVIQQAV